MSDRPCNFCDWQRMEQRGCRRATAAERKQLWEEEEDEAFNQAFDSGVVIVDKDGKFACWFMALPDHCCC